jgi:hypothetical protein
LRGTFAAFGGRAALEIRRCRTIGRVATEGRLGPWNPLTLDEAVQVFAGYKGRWWISGGWALELFVGTSWRDHEDTDIGILRNEAGLVRQFLRSWDLQVASAGQLSPWDGRGLRSEDNENNVWCRRSKEEPWCLDLTIGDGDSKRWIFRRDPKVRVEWKQAVLEGTGGIRYLAPELQLLFKSKNPRPKDDLDARQVIPLLGEERQARLVRFLSKAHPWRALLT